MIRIKLRRGTGSAWVTANPILALGEPGYAGGGAGGQASNITLADDPELALYQPGGVGGGGRGGTNGRTSTPGTAGLGGGGGGGGQTNQASPGGSGIVIIRYPI